MPAQTRTSGGRTYDEEITQALASLGHDVVVRRLPGTWPHPSPAERAHLRDALTAEPTTLLDGLVGACCPVQIEQATRAGHRVGLLIHLPLPAETGLPPGRARELAVLEHRAVAAAGVVIATSRWGAADLRRRYGRPDVATVTPGSRPGPCAVGSDPPHLLVLAALTPVKNHRVLLPALDRLTDLPWRLTVAGPAVDPDCTRAVRSWLAGSPAGHRGVFRGEVTGEDLQALWSTTDLLVLPSLTETFGLVVTEALGHGVPTLVPAGTGAVEALGEPAPGRPVDPTCPDAWHDALRAWLSDTGLRAHWRELARARRDRLRTWTQAAAELVTTLRSAGP